MQGIVPPCAREVAVTERPIDLRAADIDRAFVAERLKKALDQGRLTLSEYDERLARSYAARTYGELDQVVADLPSVIAEARGAIGSPAVGPGPAGERELLRYPWWAWLISAITIIIMALFLLGAVVMIAGN